LNFDELESKAFGAALLPSVLIRLTHPHSHSYEERDREEEKERKTQGEKEDTR